MSAKAVVVASCDARAMRKAHPKLPHLRAWREHFGKTQEWVAEQVNRAHSNVVRWESGQAGVDNETFAAIAKAYGITVAELTAPPEDAPKARQMHRLLEAAREMDADGLRTLADLAARLRTA